MLESVKISRRQSEIRQELAALAANENASEDETRAMEALDAEYRRNETRYRAALIAEDEERREAGEELETREGREWHDLVRDFEVRQVAAILTTEAGQLSGKTAEVVEELRSKGDYQGIPLPLEALELRAGETVATGTPDPVSTRPIIDRLFPAMAAGRMGVSMVSIPSGSVEWPVVTSSVAAGWADGELADVAGPTPFATTDRPLAPDHTLGVQMELSRKAMKQSGSALEAAVRRDMNSAISTALDAAVFLGADASGEPAGIIAQAAGYGINVTTATSAADADMFREEITAFMSANAASSPEQVRLMIRPEDWRDLNGQLIDGTAVSQWDLLTRMIPASNIVVTSNALPAPETTSNLTKALLTTSAGGVPPAWLGVWGAVDMIRDPYSLAGSGQVKLTGLVTVDATVSRPVQLSVISDIQRPA